MTSITPPRPELKRDDERPVFLGEDGKLRIRDPLCSSRWRKPVSGELPRWPLWRHVHYRDEG